MTTTILDSVKAEMTKKVEVPVIVDEKPIEENKPIIPVKKEPEPVKTDVTTPDPKKEPEPKKPIELDNKFKPVSYERFKEVNDKVKILQTEKAELLKNRKAPTFENDDEKEMHENFKRLGFVTKDEEDMTKFQIKEDQLHQEEQAVLNDEVKKLEREFDGSDGLPKFDKESIINRGIENQVYNPRSAYIVMNLGAIVNHLVEKELKAVNKQPIFGKNNEVKQPDLVPTEKLSLKGGTLTKFLTEKIQTMIGR